MIVRTHAASCEYRCELCGAPIFKGMRYVYEGLNAPRSNPETGERCRPTLVDFRYHPWCYEHEGALSGDLTRLRQTIPMQEFADQKVVKAWMLEKVPELETILKPGEILVSHYRFAFDPDCQVVKKEQQPNEDA